MLTSLHENKKIKNASPLEYDGISFKSKLEKMIYQTLKEQGFPVEYEPPKSIYFEIYTKKQLLQAINIIKVLSSKPKEA